MTDTQGLEVWSVDQKHLLGNSDVRSISRHHIEKSEEVPASTVPLQRSSSRVRDRDRRLPLDACSGNSKRDCASKTRWEERVCLHTIVL